MKRYALEMAILVSLIAVLLSASAGPVDSIPVNPPEKETSVETVITPPPKPPIKQTKPELDKDALGNPIDWIPVRIKVSSVGIDAEIQQVGVLPSGAMDVPKDDRKVGWLNIGYVPGEIGNAVMAGHVDNRQGVAVFYPLHNLKLGSEIEIQRADGSKLTFVVRDKQVYRTEKAPIEKIFGKSNQAMLNLITCTGYFDPVKRTHIDRLVVYAELKDEPS